MCAQQCELRGAILWLPNANYVFGGHSAQSDIRWVVVTGRERICGIPWDYAWLDSDNPPTLTHGTSSTKDAIGTQKIRLAKTKKNMKSRKNKIVARYKKNYSRRLPWWCFLFLLFCRTFSVFIIFLTCSVQLFFESNSTKFCFHSADNCFSLWL